MCTWHHPWPAQKINFLMAAENDLCSVLVEVMKNKTTTVVYKKVTTSLTKTKKNTKLWDKMKSESNEQKHVATTAAKTHFTVQPGNGPAVSLLQVQHVTHYIEVMFF